MSRNLHETTSPIESDEAPPGLEPGPSALLARQAYSIFAYGAVDILQDASSPPLEQRFGGGVA